MTRVRTYAGRAAAYALVLCVVLYFLVPLYWTLVTSLRTEVGNMSTPVSLFIPEVTLANYRAVFGNGRFMRSIVSSFIIAGASTLASLFIGSLAAFALSKLRHRFKKSLLYFFLAMTTFPGISLLSGLFAINRQLRAFDAANSWFAIPTESVLVGMYMTLAHVHHGRRHASRLGHQAGRGVV
jgi:trehalose/maltose transport system permease protein